MNQPQPTAYAQPVTKKKGSGCLLAVGIVAAALGVCFVIGAFVVYRAVKSPEGQKAVSILGAGARAINAPGTKALRQLGCSQALVMDFEDMAKVGELMSPDVALHKDRVDFDKTVVCEHPARGTPLSCDAVASTYVKAIAAPGGPFLVTVKPPGNARPDCTVVYDAAGTPTRNVP